MKNTIISVRTIDNYIFIEGFNDLYDWEIKEYTDGTFISRHRGFGQSDIWTEWAEDICP